MILDASVLIAHLEAADAHHERATQLLLDQADAEFGVSPLTMAEVLVGPARIGALASVQSAIRGLDISLVPLDAQSPERLAVLRASTRLRLPDCCVLLAAELERASLATFDERLAAAAGDLGIQVVS